MFHVFLQLRTFLETAGAMTGLIVSIALIFGVMIGVLYLRVKFKLPTVIAVVATSLGTIIFMVPATVSFSSLVDAQARNNRLDEIDKLNKEIAIKQLEHENLEKSNIITKKTIEIDSLDKQIALLKSTQASVAKMHDIAELALLKTNLKQTVVYDEPIGGAETNTLFGLIDTGTSQDKVLVVSRHDIDAKFGVDLKEIKIKKIDNNTAYKNISFDNTEQEGSVQFEAYIQGEIDTVNKQKDAKIQEITQIEAQTGDASAKPAENV